MRKKFFQYGVASSKLTKTYSNKQINIDLSLYKKLINKIITFFSDPINNFYYIIQITSHLRGKIYGSMKYKIFNI